MFKNVLWATDGSAHADRALEFAKKLVEPDGGTLHVTHVVEKLVGPRVGGQDANVNERETEAKINSQAYAVSQEGSHVEMHVATARAGEVAHGIADQATAAHADVIVVGTRGHSGVLAAVLGSVTMRLLHVVGCPVLAVPPAKPGDRLPGPPDAVATAP